MLRVPEQHSILAEGAGRSGAIRREARGGLKVSFAGGLESAAVQDPWRVKLVKQPGAHKTNFGADGPLFSKAWANASSAPGPRPSGFLRFRHQPLCFPSW